LPQQLTLHVRKHSRRNNVIAAIVATMAAYRTIENDKKARAAAEQAPTPVQAPKVGAMVSTKDSRGVLSTLGGWGRAIMSIGSSLLGIGLRLIAFGAAAWASLSVVRWTFSLASRDQSSSENEASALQAGSEGLTA
jgi:hypothetical protein